MNGKQRIGKRRGLVVAAIGIPFVLLYTTGVYYIFRGKTVVEGDGY